MVQFKRDKSLLIYKYNGDFILSGRIYGTVEFSNLLHLY